MERIIKFTSNERKELSYDLAVSFRQTGILTKAYVYFIKARDVANTCEVLRELIKRGYKSEEDLFIARACLEFYARGELEKGLQVRQAFASVKSPLLNFAEMLAEVLKMNNQALFTSVLKSYEAETKRDPNLFEFLHQISVKQFDTKLKKDSMMAQMFNMVMSSNK